MPPSQNNKDDLRQAAFRKRLALPAAVQKQAARAMMELFLKEVPLAPGLVIAGYWPMHGEINVMPLMTHLQGAGYPCALPQIRGKNMPLAFRAWHGKTPMRTGMFDFREPDPASAAVVAPDVLIAPLLAFDAAGRRLGYGAGFYAPTILQLRKTRTPLIVGVAYDTQKLGAVPAAEGVPTLDMVVTDKHVYKCG